MTCLQNSATKITRVYFSLLCVMQLEYMLGNVAMDDDKYATHVK